MKLRYFFVALVFLTTTVVFSQETFVFDGGSFTDQITLFGTDEATLVSSFEVFYFVLTNFFVRFSNRTPLIPTPTPTMLELTLELYVPHIFIGWHNCSIRRTKPLRSTCRGNFRGLRMGLQPRHTYNTLHRTKRRFLLERAVFESAARRVHVITCHTTAAQ